MTEAIDSNRIRAWIDDELVEDIERVPDETVEFNFLIEMSNILLHVIRRQPNAPVLVGQQIEYDSEIRSRIQNLSEVERNDLVARIRETLTAVPVVYGFHDKQDNNVRFVDMHRIFLEHRIYPGSIDQHALMSGLVDVWKAMRYLDDLVALLDSVEQ